MGLIENKYTLTSSNNVMEVAVVGRLKPMCVMVRAVLSEELAAKNQWGEIEFEISERLLFDTKEEAKRAAFKRKLGMSE